jgi:acetate kinase
MITVRQADENARKSPRMIDAILVLNAGSSSIKFSLFAHRAAALAPVASGQVEAIYAAPHFVAKDAAGTPVGEKRWEAGAKLAHDGALAHVLDWLNAANGAKHKLGAVGHRSA